MTPHRSYIISCTPRSGSHLLADGLASTRLAGQPTERFPRFARGIELTRAQRDAMVTDAPPEESYDAEQDAEYTKKIIELGTSPNGVFGLTLHWFQVNDAVRRIREYIKSKSDAPNEVFSLAFPNLSYIWLRRRDKVAQAVSWFKAIQTGQYLKVRGTDLGSQSAPAAATVEFDYGKIRSYWSALRSFENGWEHFFEEHRLTPLVIYYEDLAKGYESSIRQSLVFLGLGDGNVSIAPPRHEKAADEQSLLWVERFRSMQASARPRPVRHTQ